MIDGRDVSVIIPAKNAGRFLGDALNSVAGQTAPVGEVIVVDDGSHDATAKIADGYQAPFALRVVATAGVGAAAARNAGVRASAGALLAFLDADDVWLNVKLERQLALPGLAEGAAIAFGHCREFSDPEGRFPIRAERMAAPSLSSMLIARTAFEQVGAFREDLPAGELMEWLNRSAASGLETHYVEGAEFLRRVHAHNSTRSLEGGRRVYLELARQRRRQGSVGA